MNRKDFLKDLRRELERLPFEERESAITYYEEYLDEAGPENEAEAIRSFGSPASIAAGLRAEEAMNTPPTTPKEGGEKDLACAPGNLLRTHRIPAVDCSSRYRL